MADHHRSEHSPAGLSRGDFLRLGGLTAAATGLGVAGMQLGPLTAPASAAPSVTRMGEVTGPGITSGWGVTSTDLGIPARTPDGRILAIFGDTWSEQGVGNGDWRSPVGLYADPQRPLAEGIAWTGAVGGDYASWCPTRTIRTRSPPSCPATSSPSGTRCTCG